MLPRWTEEALRVIDSHAAAKRNRDADKPQMLYLAYTAPHTPWLPSAAFEGKSAAGMYEDFRMMMMIRSGDWKFINGLGSGGFSQPKTIRPEPGGPEGQLYNLRDDPAETRNLYLEQPSVVAGLKAEMQRIVEAGQSRGADRVDLSTKTSPADTGYPPAPT